MRPIASFLFLVACCASTLGAQGSEIGLAPKARLLAHHVESKEGLAPCFTLVVGLANSAGNRRWFSVPRLEPMHNYLLDADPGVSYRLVVRDETGRDIVRPTGRGEGLTAPSAEDFAVFSVNDVIGTEICLDGPWFGERLPAGRYSVSAVVESRASEWVARKRKASPKAARHLPPEDRVLNGRTETEPLSLVLR
jgi:hypothetical protein